jgi:hypothetical protein
VLLPLISHPLPPSPTISHHLPPSPSITLRLRMCMQVAYADVLLPLIDTAAVVRKQWQYVDDKLGGHRAATIRPKCMHPAPPIYRYVDEKLGGIVQQLSSTREQYDSCVPHLAGIIGALITLTLTSTCT